ncbi:Rv3654c family TadE-like protein [Streptomyces sp. NPDC051104]|uniref:Rv3654c family TadE-like protein n=1 Tax=Streptomyces sp. NPDC051104 TaxID=3155044 RepID=UPI00343ABB74
MAAARSDRGTATVWVLCLLGAMCAVFGVLLAQGEVVLARHRAAGAADLAALAAADHWMDGGGKACATAARVARAQGSRLVRCALVGAVSDVTAASAAGPFTTEVRARAGPAEPRAPQPRAPQPPDRSPPPRAPRAAAP